MKRSGDVEGLLSLLDTGDVKEIREAVRILGELRYRKAARPLIGLLEKDDIQVRANSAWSLGEIGEAKAVLPLIGLLNDPSENVQIYAAWALGRIGDKRAINALEAALENGSTELRKHAKEAIARIESNTDGKRYKDNGGYREDNIINSSEPVEIPLVTLDVPMDRLECDYITRAEGESKKGKMKFSGDVAVKDIINPGQGSTRQITLGLKKNFGGLVSVDVLFRYKDNKGDTSSVWVRMATSGESPAKTGGDDIKEREPDLEAEEPVEETGRRVRRHDVQRARAKPGRKISPRRVEYEIPEYRQEEPEDDVREEEQPAAEEFVPEERPERRALKRRAAARLEAVPFDKEREEPGAREDTQAERSLKERPEHGIRDIKAERAEKAEEAEKIDKVEPAAGVVKTQAIPVVDKAAEKSQEKEIKPDRAETKVQEIKPKAVPQPQAERQVEKPQVKETKTEKIEPKIQEVKPVKAEPEIKAQLPPQAQVGKAAEKPQAAPQPASQPVPQPAPQTAKAGVSVDSAVKFLSDIGMSGVTEAASTVTQLGGQEAEELQSRLRTLPADQIPEEIVNLGEYAASIEVKLHGKSQAGELNGIMHMYFSKDVALSIANELLGNQPDAAVKEFNEDITSTLKETANIFGGQYVSAISEYIEIPILLEAPNFKTGPSSQLAESMMKDIAGKIDFALATDLAFGNNKTGRLIMLLDPKSYDIIITKLF
ncbi:MAG: HEAT repeat domain-containing protein [Candidatus Methanoperedens sp.]|nr:HEAT repeat domain-containing protein [Candidatus Methanoperedens sp.]